MRFSHAAGSESLRDIEHKVEQFTLETRSAGDREGNVEWTMKQSETNALRTEPGQTCQMKPLDQTLLGY